MENESPQTAAAPSDPSPLATLVGVIIRPRSTFTRMREAVRGHWWLVFVLALVALVLVIVATIPIQAEATEAAIAAQQEQLGELSAEQQAQIEQTQAIFSSAAMLGAIGTLSGVIGLVINYAVRAGLLFLMGQLLGGQASFKQVWRMAVWTSLPGVISSFISGITIIISGNLPVAGLANVFTGTETGEVSPVLLAVLGRIDIFAIWSVVLIAVGMIATTRISRGKGILAAVIYWLLGVGWAAAGAAIGLALTSAFGVTP
jgi:hypothetical protein